MTVLSQHPVSSAIEADLSSFQLYKTGVLTATSGTELHHDAVAVVYGTVQFSRQVCSQQRLEPELHHDAPCRFFSRVPTATSGTELHPDALAVCYGTPHTGVFTATSGTEQSP